MPTANRGRFVWYDHLTRDVPAAVAFYSEVVGWKTEPFGDQGYRMWLSDQGPLGGVMALGDAYTRAGTPPHWTAYVQVDDVDATARRAEALGGRVSTPPTDIPTVGRFAVLADPQGASLSIFRPGGEEMAPHDVSRDGEFRWNELGTTDGAAALRVYGELFGWKIVHEMDMGADGKYLVFGLGAQQLGGISAAPAGKAITPGWLYYVSTSDLDAAVARARRAGAKLTNGPMDVPDGRIAQLLDPQGAGFALHEAAE